MIGKKVKYNGITCTITDYFEVTDLIMLNDEITISRNHAAIEWPKELPKFVMIETDGRLHSALRLTEKGYYRDGGIWSIGYKIIDGILYSWYPDMPWLHRQPLIEISEEEWRKDNGHYAPKNP